MKTKLLALSAIIFSLFIFSCKENLGSLEPVTGSLTVNVGDSV